MSYQIIVNSTFFFYREYIISLLWFSFVFVILFSTFADRLLHQSAAFNLNSQSSSLLGIHVQKHYFLRHQGYFKDIIKLIRNVLNKNIHSSKILCYANHSSACLRYPDRSDTMQNARQDIHMDTVYSTCFSDYHIYPN